MIKQLFILFFALIASTAFAQDDATFLNNKGLAYDRQDNYTKALETFLEALDIRLKELGAEHPYVAQSYNNIGSVYDQWGNYPLALDYFQKALAIWEKALGKDHSNTTRELDNVEYL